VEVILFDTRPMYLRISIALLNHDVVRIAFQGWLQYLASLLLRTSSAMCEVLWNDARSWNFLKTLDVSQQD
jgi:hypothetical protein